MQTDIKRNNIASNKIMQICISMEEQALQVGVDVRGQLGTSWSTYIGGTKMFVLIAKEEVT